MQFQTLLASTLASLTLAASLASAAPSPPPAGQTLVIIGQDLDSVAAYVRDCKNCPTPGGITEYLGFYSLTNPHAQFGGLGQDPLGKDSPVADWGAGITSAAQALQTYPKSALVLGLDISEGNRPGGMGEILRGLHDDKIARLANFCARARRPVYLRIGYEFDGTWNAGYSNREQFKAVWRYIVDAFRAAGAGNVAFVWQASASPLDDILEGGSHEDIRDWYPGTKYVDWMALSWFLAPEAGPTVGVKPPTQRELADEVLAFARAERKPVMIAESAPQGYDVSTLSRANITPLWNGLPGKDVVKLDAAKIWAEWYQPLFDYLQKNRDVIRAFAYINARWDDQKMWGPPYDAGYWGDSRVQANPEIERRWTEELAKSRWLHAPK